MNPASICRTFVLVGLVAVAACGGDGGGSSAPPNGPAQVSTLAYVVSRCHEEKGGSNFSFSQALWVQRGDQPPVKIEELALGQSPIGGICRLWGQNRAGGASVLNGAFQRLGVSPNGSLILFEVRISVIVITGFGIVISDSGIVITPRVASRWTAPWVRSSG